MKIYLAILVTAVLTFILGEWGPWWMVLIAPLPAVFAFRLGALKAALSGYVGVGLCWLIYSFVLSNSNEYIMAERAGAMFGGLSGTAFILVTSFLGGILGALSALLGWAISNTIKLSSN